jgi:hypothetical protein
MLFELLSKARAEKIQQNYGHLAVQRATSLLPVRIRSGEIPISKKHELAGRARYRNAPSLDGIIHACYTRRSSRLWPATRSCACGLATSGVKSELITHPKP